MTSPAHVMRGHSCCAKTLHAVVVYETCLLEGFHCLINLLVCSCDVPANKDKKQWAIEHFTLKSNLKKCIMVLQDNLTLFPLIHLEKTLDHSEDKTSL